MEAGVVRFLKRTKEATFEDIYDSLCHSIKLFRPQPSVFVILCRLSKQ